VERRVTDKNNKYGYEYKNGNSLSAGNYLFFAGLGYYGNNDFLFGFVQKKVEGTLANPVITLSPEGFDVVTVDYDGSINKSIATVGKDKFGNRVPYTD